jgi:hypothetical protein
VYTLACSVPCGHEYAPLYLAFKPVTVAERSRACTVFARSETGIVGSNSTHGKDIWCLCVCTFLCLYTAKGLATSRSLTVARLRLLTIYILQFPLLTSSNLQR